MKLVVLNIESLGAVSSIDLDTVFSVEPNFEFGEYKKSVQLIMWSKYRFSGDASDFYIIDVDLEDSEIDYNEAKETTMKVFNIIIDFWTDDSKKTCFITDSKIRGYIPKARSLF